MKYSELAALYSLPLFDLVSKAHQVHVENWPGNEVQICTLMSIKTGGCSENCSYCAQSAHYSTAVQRENLVPCEAVLERAMLAKANGSTRFCMGAAWKGISSESPLFKDVLAIIQAVSGLGMEVCMTLGKMGKDDAVKLKEAGLTAYTHNIDTSPEHYGNIVTTHTFEDRLETIRNIQDAGIAVCCGGILGLGEKEQDRLRMLEIISEFNPAPESMPINALIPIEGTPLAERNPAPVDSFDIIRMVALARIAMPKTRVRLSAGRESMSKEAQAMAFYAGANSMFYGDKLLTASNSACDKDIALIESLGLKVQRPDPSLLAPLPDPDKPLFPDHEPHGCVEHGPCEHVTVL